MITAAKRFLPKYLRAAGASLYLFSAGVFSRRHRFLIFQIAEHFGLKVPPPAQPIPQILLGDILGPHLDLELREALGAPGNVSLLELLVIATLARQARPAAVFEIGTFDGRTTLNLAANLPEEGEVWTLDLPRSGLDQTRFKIEAGERAFVAKEESGAKYRSTEQAAKITQLYGDSATFDFSPFEKRAGLVFVDGSHTEEYLRHDSSTALRLAAAGGGRFFGTITSRIGLESLKGLNDLYRTDPAFSALRRIEGTTLVMLQLENTRR